MTHPNTGVANFWQWFFQMKTNETSGTSHRWSCRQRKEQA